MFIYPPGTTAANFSFPDHVPEFFSDIVQNAPRDVLLTCEGVPQCVFDATQTGNMEVGLDTMRFFVESNMDRALMGKQGLVLNYKHGHS